MVYPGKIPGTMRLARSPASISQLCKNLTSHLQRKVVVSGALEEQLGLHLGAGTVSIDVPVIESAERLSAS